MTAVKIDDFSGYSRLVMSHMKRGVLTNCFLSPISAKCEIAEGRLFAHEDKESGALLLFRRRDGFDILNYYVTDGNFKTLDDVKTPVVCETVARNDEKLIEMLPQLGFQRMLERVKLERQPTSFITAEIYPTVHTAELSDAKGTVRVLSENLPQFTGCVPTLSEAEHDIESGYVYIEKVGKKVTAALRVSIGKTSCEIKQLAVDKKYRGTGAGTRLLRTFLHFCGTKKISVWTGSENAAALQLYRSAGFTLSESRSFVFGKNIK